MTVQVVAAGWPFQHTCPQSQKLLLSTLLRKLPHHQIHHVNTEDNEHTCIICIYIRLAWLLDLPSTCVSYTYMYLCKEVSLTTTAGAPLILLLYFRETCSSSDHLIREARIINQHKTKINSKPKSTQNQNQHKTKINSKPKSTQSQNQHKTKINTKPKSTQNQNQHKTKINTKPKSTQRSQMWA